MAGKTVGGLAHVCSPNVRVGRTCSSTRTSVVGTSTVGTRTSTVRTSTHLGTYLGRKMSREARPTTSATLECVRVLFAETAIAGRNSRHAHEGWCRGTGGEKPNQKTKQRIDESMYSCGAHSCGAPWLHRNRSRCARGSLHKLRLTNASSEVIGRRREGLSAIFALEATYSTSCGVCRF